MLHVIRKCLKLVKQGNNQWLLIHVQFSSVQSLSRVQLFATPWNAAHQASLSITSSQSPPKPMSIESVMPSNHLSPSVVPFSFCLQSFPDQDLFKWVSSLHRVARVLEFQLQHQSFQWTPRMDLLLEIHIYIHIHIHIIYFVFFIVLKLHNYGRETSLIKLFKSEIFSSGRRELI